MRWLIQILIEHEVNDKDTPATVRAIPDEARRAFLQQYVRNLENAPPLRPEVLSAIRSEAAIYNGRLAQAQRLEAARQYMRYTG